MDTLTLTVKDVKAIKIALAFAIETSPTEASTLGLRLHMQQLLDKFNNIVIPEREKH